jgi:hypothetical protein
LAAVLKPLLENAAFAFEDRSALLQALAAYQQSCAGFADHLIGAKEQSFGATTTFASDRPLRNCVGFSVLDGFRRLRPLAGGSGYDTRAPAACAELLPPFTVPYCSSSWIAKVRSKKLYKSQP